MNSLEPYKMPRRGIYRGLEVIVHQFLALGGVSRALIEYPMHGRLEDVEAYLVTLRVPGDESPIKVKAVGEG